MVWFAVEGRVVTTTLSVEIVVIILAKLGNRRAKGFLVRDPVVKEPICRGLELRGEGFPMSNWADFSAKAAESSCLGRRFSNYPSRYSIRRGELLWMERR